MEFPENQKKLAKNESNLGLEKKYKITNKSKFYCSDMNNIINWGITLNLKHYVCVCDFFHFLSGYSRTQCNIKLMQSNTNFCISNIKPLFIYKFVALRL